MEEKKEKLKHLISPEDLIWIGRLEEKIRQAKTLDEIEMYDHHIGSILLKYVLQQKIRMLSKKKRS